MKIRTARVDRKTAAFDLLGVDTGGPGTVVAWNRRDGYLTVRFEGGKYWSSRGQQSYAPARFSTYRVGLTGVTDDDVVLTVEEIVTNTVRAKALKIPKDLS